MSDGQDNNGHSNGHSILERQDELFHSQPIAGWRAEIATFLQDCLREVQSIAEMLHSVGQQTVGNAGLAKSTLPLSAPEPAEDTAILTSRQFEAMNAGDIGLPEYPSAALHKRDDYPSMSARPQPPTASTNTDDDFDSRLANLKRMLAEKLTNSESSAGTTTPGQQSHE